ncbi:MAG: MBL fold metallo-hydrolase [Patescibacteria group bacterium]
MIISYFGKQFFKITLGDLTIALDPFGKDSKEKGPRFGADVAISSINHPDMNGTDQVFFGDKKPYVISGPGEYEIKDVFIKGFLSKSYYGGEETQNTIYVIKLEDINVLFLGAFGETDLPPLLKEELEDVDILFIPIGSNGVLKHADASKLATKLEPKVIIPMAHTPLELKNFLKEEGEEDTKSVEKLVIKRKDLLEKSSDIIVIEASS